MDLSKAIPQQMGRTGLTLHAETEKITITFHYPRTTVTSILSLPRYVDEKLFLLGIALYAGEGTKAPQRKPGTSQRSAESQEVEFVNDNPKIINCFLDFLKLLGFDRQDCVARLKSTSEDLENNLIYWSKITGIAKRNFSNPIIRKTRFSTRLSKHGSLTIRVYCRPLWRILTYWSTNLDLFYK